MTHLPPAVLYKYMSSRRIDFFEKPTLRFTHPSEFNDICDCQFISKGLLHQEFIDKSLDEIGIDDIFKIHIRELSESERIKLLKDKRQVNALKKDMSRRLQREQPQIKKMVTKLLQRPEVNEKMFLVIQKNMNESNLGVLCLTGDNKSKQMWGLYGENKGFVVGLDTTNLFFDRRISAEDLMCRLVPVVYSNHRLEIYFSDYLDANDSKFWIDLLYTKDQEWSYEKEWRMIITTSESLNVEVSGVEEIPIELIKDIYIGANADEALLENALTFCKQYNIPAYRMHLKSNGLLEHEKIFTP